MPIASPLVVPNCHAWYDASQEVYADGAAVSSFADRSGAGRHATQATALLQPVFRAAGLMGAPTIETSGNQRVASASWGVIAQPWTIFVVGASTVSTVDAVQVSALASTNRIDVGPSLSQWRYAAGVNVRVGTSDALPRITTALINGAGSSIRVDEGLIGSGNPGANGWNGITIGNFWSGGFPAGKISEVILYTRALTALEIADVEEYLRVKWWSGTDPLGIPQCILWYDATQDGLADGVSVSSWTDRSLVSGAATQGTLARQPVFRTAGINGLPALEFTASAPSFLLAPRVFQTGRSTTFAVYLPAAGHAAAQYVLASNQVSGSDNRFRYYIEQFLDDAVSVWGTNVFTPSSATRLSHTAVRGAAALHMMRSTGAGLTSFHKCPEDTKTSATAYNGKGHLAQIGAFMGPNQGLQGKIGEILHYDRALTDPEVASVIAYLVAKWGITCITGEWSIGFIPIG